MCVASNNEIGMLCKKGSFEIFRKSVFFLEET